MTSFRHLSLALAFALAAGTAAAYETKPPKYIEAEVVWRDAAGKEQTTKGQLWFRDLPVVTDGRVHGFGRPGHYDGIKWFVPKAPGDITLARGPGESAPQTFLLRDYCGERPVTLAFTTIPVARTADSVLDKLMDRDAKAVGSGRGAGQADVSGRIAEELDELAGEVPIITAPVESTIGSGDGQPGSEKPPVHFATDRDIGITALAVADIVRISFGKASGNYEREVYGGRFVEYSRQATGDEGRVQPVAATFCGGPATDERFAFGDFLPDGNIVLAGNFHDLGFVDPGLVQVVGEDPAPDAYPSVEREDPKQKTRVTDHPRRTVTFVQYSADLLRLTGVARLPWGVGEGLSFQIGPDAAIYAAGRAGPHLETFLASVPGSATVPFPEAVAPDARGQTRKPGPDGFVVKLSPDRKKVLWAVRFRHATVTIFLLSDGRLLCRRSDRLFFIEADGRVTDGPKLDVTGGTMAVDPRNGVMYVGGSYRSATGLEPYVNPYLYKVDVTGKVAWTAYGWTGPIVGVDQLRLVSDSAVTKIRVAEDGRLTLSAWSDGGNTVLGQQPCDLRKPAAIGGFCSSTWGAKGGLTTRIAHLISMDSDTTDVPGFTRYVGYIPTSDVPTLINIYDFCRLPNGEVAVTGAGWNGFVESHDAWIRPWWIEHQTDEFAMAKGGPFFTVFSADFNRVRIATLTPGASGLQLASRGRHVLVYGGATDLPQGAVDEKWARRFRTIVRNAVQPENGGGLDAYVMLVDTQGPPNPPVIPAKTWGQPAKRGR